MAFAELRGRLGRCFQQMSNTSIVDELKDCLKEITGALLDAGFPVIRVNEMERKIQEIINLPTESKGKQIYQIVLEELCSMLDPGHPPFVKGRNRERSIVMFMGLRGVEKSGTCAKYVRYHLKMKKGFRPALVLADTLKTDAFVPLKNEIPVYECDTTDPAKIAIEGIAKFIKDKHNLIVVDTSGRHEDCSGLFQEMRQLAQETDPDLVLFVIDSSIGQAAFEQAQAFRQSFTAGIAILTNINGNSKAGAALTAVARAKCPMILTETEGEKSEEFEEFKVKPFVRKLLENPWFSPAPKYKYTLRQMYTFYREDLGLEEKVFDFPPRGKRNLEKMKLYTTIMDSMTDEELDKSNVKQVSKERMMEIAKESKVDVKQVREMMKAYKMKAKGFLEIEEMKPYAPCGKIRFGDI